MAIKSNGQKSVMHDIISKDNTRMVIAVSGAVFVVIFCLFASRALLSQSFYQNKVISEKKDTLKIVEANKDAVSDLEKSYISFATEPVNVIGGNPTGTGSKDGDNAKIVLDSLPDVLDYPALSSSIEKILLDGGYTIQSIGSDDQVVAISTTGEEASESSVSVPTEIAYPFKVATTPESALSLMQTLESSIRPFSVTDLKIEGASNNLEISIGMKTYYQSSSGLQVGTKVVK
jgi:hypothetical protein